MNMARSTFYKRPHAGHRAAREKADTDLRVRIEDILAESEPVNDNGTLYGIN